jgi:hypothetical protein
MGNISKIQEPLFVYIHSETRSVLSPMNGFLNYSAATYEWLSQLGAPDSS